MNDRTVAVVAVVSRIARDAALLAALGGLGLGCAGDDRRASRDPGSGATETNVAPAPCNGADDCPEGIECVTFDGGEGPGFCDVNEMTVAGDGGAVTSSAAPAPCARASDCPPGIACVSFDGPGSPGFCDVVEMVAP